MANRPGSLSLLEALEMSKRRYEAEQARKPKASPFDFGQSVRDADEAIQQGVFGAVDAVVGEGKRLADNWVGLKDIGQGAQRLSQSNLADVLASMGTGPARVGQGWTRPDLTEERGALGQLGGGALDASMLIPSAGAVKGARKFAGDVAGELAASRAARPAIDEFAAMRGRVTNPMTNIDRSIADAGARADAAYARMQPSPWGSQAQLNMGFGFGGKDGEKPLFSALMDAFKGKPKQSPLDQFTPPTSLDDIFTGGGPRGPREITGGSQNPAGLEGSAFNDPRFGNGAQKEIPYDPAMGFQGADARMAQAKNRNTLSEALAKAKREGASENDLLGLLLAYGGLGGMSAGALATMDAQQKAPQANLRGF